VLSGGKKSQCSKRSKPEQKRVWASLQKTKDDIIQEVGKKMGVRDPHGCKKHVVVTEVRSVQAAAPTRRMR
jgi:hypothetical protein